MKIVKILNNNAVIAEDEDGLLRVLLGCGLAFGRKAGERVDFVKVEKEFIFHKSYEKNGRISDKK